jgi:hypothetical protein
MEGLGVSRMIRGRSLYCDNLCSCDEPTALWNAPSATYVQELREPRAIEERDFEVSCFTWVHLNASGNFDLTNVELTTLTRTKIVVGAVRRRERRRATTILGTQHGDLCQHSPCRTRFNEIDERERLH